MQRDKFVMPWLTDNHNVDYVGQLLCGSICRSLMCRLWLQKTSSEQDSSTCTRDIWPRFGTDGWSVAAASLSIWTFLSASIRQISNGLSLASIHVSKWSLKWAMIGSRWVGRTYSMWASFISGGPCWVSSPLCKHYTGEVINTLKFKIDYYSVQWIYLVSLLKSMHGCKVSIFWVILAWRKY